VNNSGFSVLRFKRDTIEHSFYDEKTFKVLKKLEVSKNLQSSSNETNGTNSDPKNQKMFSDQTKESIVKTMIGV